MRVGNPWERQAKGFAGSLGDSDRDQLSRVENSLQVDLAGFLQNFSCSGTDMASQGQDPVVKKTHRSLKEVCSRRVFALSSRLRPKPWF